MIALPLFLMAGAAAAVLPEARQADVAWVAEGEFCEPETVLPLPDGTLLVSNVCDFRKTGNGFLTLLGADGTVIRWRIVDRLDAPLGMALAGDRLHVVDGNRVKVFRWPGYALLATVELGTSVANDIAVAADGTWYVTDTGSGQVVVRAPDGDPHPLDARHEFSGANGIQIDGEILYVGGERLWRVDLATRSVATVGPSWLADIDGIEFEPNGTLQITPVGGPLVRYRNDNDIEVLGGDGISSANHGYAADLKLALIPTGFDNTVIAIRIPSGRDGRARATQ
ncbi:MAG: hypothetical protein AAFX58_03780 [Pseudomonadota bacterium]